MEQFIRILIARLVGRGMEITSIPAFIRNVASSITANPSINLEDLNSHLQLLGWNDFDLDSYTLFLIMAIFEPDPESSLTRYFDASFTYQSMHELQDIHVENKKRLQE